jgi:hypothetical protein
MYFFSLSTQNNLNNFDLKNELFIGFELKLKMEYTVNYEDEFNAGKKMKQSLKL